jgi:hypothetical protein
MKLKVQLVLGFLFLATFAKSFKYSSNSFDVVFIILITIVYLAHEFITEQKTKSDLDILTKDINTRLNLQDEELERIKNNTSKMALSAGIRR